MRKMLFAGGLLVGMELSDFAGGENGVDVNLTVSSMRQA
jgi:hypothetical protein